MRDAPAAGAPCTAGAAPTVSIAAVDRRLGLLGGTFDPPHLGHLVVAECARVALGLEEVRFVVAGAPWMKEESATPEQRVEMTRLAVRDDPPLTVDDREVRRAGPTYTVDTLTELSRAEPDVPLFFLAGADAVEKLARWHRPADCLALATFVAVTRPGFPLDLDGPLLRRVRLLEVPPIGVTSTDLRHRFGSGGAVRHQLPPVVEDYVRKHGLYGASDHGP